MLVILNHLNSSKELRDYYTITKKLTKKDSLINKLDKPFLVDEVEYNNHWEYLFEELEETVGELTISELENLINKIIKKEF